MTVVPRYPKNYFEGAITFSNEEVARVEKQWADKSHRTLDAVSARAKSAGARIKTAIVQSDLVAESLIAARRRSTRAT